MPSSHSATVTALAAAIGFHEGFGGPLFATALVLACIVCLYFFKSINFFFVDFIEGLIVFLIQNLILELTFTDKKK